MNPGELRHRITIQKKADVNNQENQDSYGQPKEPWDNVATVWCSINPIVGKEFFAAETVNSEITHKIRIRYRLGITPDMRVKFNDRNFSIQSAINYQERNIELQLMCRELI
jgi:SPP1 family predicted phage head-tail adaptor